MGIRSAHGEMFFHRCAVAARSGWACLLVGLVLEYALPVYAWIAIPLFSLVICLNIIDTSIGAILWNAVGVLIGMAQAMTIGVVVLSVLGTKLSLAPALVCIFVASFVVSYPNSNHQMARKVALGQIGIIFITAHTGQNKGSLFFLVRLMVTSLIGAACAIVAVLIPVPGLACWEARTSARSAVRETTELFQSLVEAFCAREASIFSSISVHAKFLYKLACNDISELKSRQVHATWELKGLGLILTFQRMVKGLSGLQLHLLGMTLALQSGTILLTPGVMSAVLKGPLERIAEKSRAVLDLTTKLSKSEAVLLEKQERLAEAKAEFKLLDEAIMLAREETYYREKAEEQSLDDLLANPNPHGYSANKNIKQLLRTMVPTYFFLFNLRMFFIETMNMVDSDIKVANVRSAKVRKHQIAPVDHKILTLKQNASSTNPKRSPSSKGGESQTAGDKESNECPTCGCQHQQPIETMNMDDSSAKVAKVKSAKVRKHQVAPVDHEMFTLEQSVSSTNPKRSPSCKGGESHTAGDKESGECPTCRCQYQQPIETMSMVDSGTKVAKVRKHQIAPVDREIFTLEQNAPSTNQKRSPSSKGGKAHTAGDKETGESPTCGCQYQQPKLTRRGACLKLLEDHGMKPDRRQFARAFKISLAMAVAALGGIKYNKEYAYWANVSIGFIVQAQQGGSFRMGSLRLQGTALGAIYGYLAILVTHNYRYQVLICLIPWVTLLSYLRFSKIFGPSGAIAGLTAAVIMLGPPKRMTAPIQEFAVIRIVENFIGVLCLVVVETVVWPNRARTLCRDNLVSSLTGLRDCVANVIAAYTGNYCSKHRRMVVQEIKKLEQALRTRFAQQVNLQSEAVMEPELWNVPFPAEIYSKLNHIQGRMLDLLFFMICSLHAATEDCLKEQIEKLVGPLQTSLVALEDEVLSSLDFLQKVLQVKRDKIPSLSKKLPWNLNDEENQLGQTQGSLLGDLGKLTGEVHPLLLLECRQRAVDGTPLSMQATMEAFEVSYEEVVCGFIAAKKENPGESLLSNSAMLSFSAVTFSLKSLLKETAELEKAVHELLHCENPWSGLEFGETFPEVLKCCHRK